VLLSLSDYPHLKSLDISGNNVGEKGAILVAKALQNNDVLESLLLDENDVGHIFFFFLSFVNDNVVSSFNCCSSLLFSLLFI
jgi:hypothetical protein